MREKRGTWRLPSDATSVADRRFERQKRDNARRSSPETPSLSPQCAAVGASIERGTRSSGRNQGSSIDNFAAKGAASSWASPQERSAGGRGRENSANASTTKMEGAAGLRVRRGMVKQALGAEHNEDKEWQRHAADESEQHQDQTGRWQELGGSPEGTTRRSITSTGRSIQSFVSAQTFTSAKGYHDDLEGLSGGNVKAERVRGSGSDSDLEEFFDAVAPDTDADEGEDACFVFNSSM